MAIFPEQGFSSYSVSAAAVAQQATKTRMMAIRSDF